MYLQWTKCTNSISKMIQKKIITNVTNSIQNGTNFIKTDTNSQQITQNEMIKHDILWVKFTLTKRKKIKHIRESNCFAFYAYKRLNIKYTKDLTLTDFQHLALKNIQNYYKMFTVNNILNETIATKIINIQAIKLLVLTQTTINR